MSNMKWKNSKYSGVSRLPVIEGNLTKDKIEEIKAKYPGQPNNMDYRKEFLKGRGASSKDDTWDRVKRQHTCCESKVSWRHKANCAKLNHDDEGNELWKALETTYF